MCVLAETITLTLTDHLSSSHVVGDVYRIKAVLQETVAEMHALLLAARIDGNRTRVGDRHHAGDQVVLFEYDVGHLRDDYDVNKRSRLCRRRRFFISFNKSFVVEVICFVYNAGNCGSVDST